MEYSNLFDVIQSLQYGTNLHIGVLFFNNYGNPKCALPFDHKIHSRVICDELKKRSKTGYSRRFMCRNLAIQKAISQKKPFGGLCINGIYEYTHPVVIQDEVACVIFIGNILRNEKGAKNPEEKLGEKGYLIQTLEKDFSDQSCVTMAQIVESYIRFLFEKYGMQDKSENLLIKSIKNYLETNLEYDISISHITKIFHYNQQYLGRLFKKETGQSVKEYIMMRRMERAKASLEIGNETVTEIANAVGFNNVTYFNRQFKNLCNMTPTQYRNLYRKNQSLRHT